LLFFSNYYAPFLDHFQILMPIFLINLKLLSFFFPSISQFYANFFHPLQIIVRFFLHHLTLSCLFFHPFPISMPFFLHCYAFLYDLFQILSFFGSISNVYAIFLTLFQFLVQFFDESFIVYAHFFHPFQKLVTFCASSICMLIFFSFHYLTFFFS